MDLLSILATKPDPPTIHESQFFIDKEYQNSGDYKLATPLSDFQKELIDQIVSLHYSDILKFFERVTDAEGKENANVVLHEDDSMRSPQEKVIIDSLETLLLNTQLVCSHPYLLIEHYFPKSLTGKDIPKRLADTSGKFKILAILLDLLDSIYNPEEKESSKDKDSKSKKIHHHNNNNQNKDKDTEDTVTNTKKIIKRKEEPIDIVILSRPGKCIDLLDALCMGHRCIIKRYIGSKIKENSHHKSKTLNLTVHILPSDMKELRKDMALPKNVKFIIPFDISCNLDNEKINQMKSRDCKIIRLVPINTIEHIALYYRDLVTARNYSDYLKPVTAAVVVMRDKVGQLPSDLRAVYSQNLEYLSNFLYDPKSNKWPLPEFSPIPYFTSKDVEKSLRSEVKFTFEDDENSINGNGFNNSSNENNGGSTNADADGVDSTGGTNETLQPINFNVGGKTQMVGHIFEPMQYFRLSRKTKQEKIDFYETKRLEKNYLSNPLVSKDYSHLSGIIIGDEENDNDISSNGGGDRILTHKLMHQFTTKLYELEKLNSEFKSYEDYSSIRQNNMSIMIEAYDKMKTEYDENNKNKIDLGNKINDSFNKLNELKGEISTLEDKINVIGVNDGNESSKLTSQWIKNEREIIELEDSIESATAKSVGLQSETEYMNVEIERANKSKIDSNVEIERLTEEYNKLITEFKEFNKFSSSDTDDNKLKLQDLEKSQELLKQSKEELDEVLSQLSETFRKLSDSNLRSRYVNYSRKR
ncbi:hypothetical protein BVG19_g4586 [[Candida] boidinii]|nr:hypothetical protein BVG19_g4586 [[Candida] boidinii]OWB51646.1 hypothetical protein B5S27_g3211 [[Candida] boidinii]